MADSWFRPATNADLPMLAGWLAAPGIARWWPDAARQIALIQADLTNPAMTQLIVTSGDGPIGYAQHCRAADSDNPLMASLPKDSLALDAFANPMALGQGSAWLKTLGDQLLRHAPLIAVDPEPANRRALRAYEKAGFDHPAHPPSAPRILMTRRR